MEHKMFIHKELENQIIDYLKPFIKDYMDQRFEFEYNGYFSTDRVYDAEITGFHKDDYDPEKQTPFILLRYYINYEYKQIHISNIFLPMFMRYKGIGKALLGIVYQFAEEKNYELFLVDMVPGFYDKMLERGAIPCTGHPDAVQIVKETRLY